MSAAAMVGLTPAEVRLDPPGLVLGVLRDGEVTPILPDPKLREGDVLITLVMQAQAA